MCISGSLQAPRRRLKLQCATSPRLVYQRSQFPQRDEIEPLWTSCAANWWISYLHLLKQSADFFLLFAFWVNTWKSEDSIDVLAKKTNVGVKILLTIPAPFRLLCEFNALQLCIFAGSTFAARVATRDNFWVRKQMHEHNQQSSTKKTLVRQDGNCNFFPFDLRTD